METPLLWILFQYQSQENGWKGIKQFDDSVLAQQAKEECEEQDPVGQYRVEAVLIAAEA